MLDVGAGSGRDALALARIGYNVVAVEPTSALRQHAQAVDLEGVVDWVDDRLPGLSKLKGRGPIGYGFILCSAVLMHVPPDELVESFASLAIILEPGGVLAISVRPPLSGEPKSVFHRHDAGTLRAAASAANLSLISEQVVDDVRRPSIHWRTMVFRAPHNEGCGETTSVIR